MAKRNLAPIHPAIRERLGFAPDATDKHIWETWNNRANRVCKPCWELKYCPYGSLVEDSPLLLPTLDAAQEHFNYAKQCLATGMVGCGEPLTDEEREMYEQCVATFDEDDYVSDPTGEITITQIVGHLKDVELTREAAIHVNEQMKRSLKTGMAGHHEPMSPSQKQMFEREVADFNPEDYPEKIPDAIAEKQCTVFGHLCPVIFHAREITETTELRKTGRYIPFKTKIRIVRRDNYTCQHCGEHLLDSDVEFDHVIPVSKGGSSEESNIRLTCFDCNRSKSDNYEA